MAAQDTSSARRSGQDRDGDGVDDRDESLSVGAGLRVGAGAYKEGEAAIAPNPYWQSGTVETAGYGGPPNIGAVTPVFAKARHNALLFAGEVVNDTTGNASGVGKGVGEGLAPELVTLTPLTGQAARDAEVDRVQAAAAYQTANPVMLHQLDDGVVAAGQPADEYGNPVEDDDATDVEDRDGQRTTGPVSGGGSQSGPTAPSSTEPADEDYDDQSSRDNRSTGSVGAKGGQQTGQQQRSKVDPTRQQGSSS
jgi:hypothetical protein